MRFLTSALTAAVVLIYVVDATAQPGRPPSAPRAGTRPGGSSTSNTLTTGNNTNTNSNSNSQFLSGSNTGVNNGSLEVYSGADPYQGIVLEGSVNLPQLPLVPSAPSNFSQPYKPDTFINTPVFLPTEMTLTEAKECRSAKSSWYGGSRDEEASSMQLLYARKPASGPDAVTMASYVGTAMVTTSDGPFIAALCEAAYRAMRKGATTGMVEFSIRPKNTMFGIGFGAAGGASGLPAAGAHPYALAGTLGFGTGWSNQRVEGEVVLQLTALRGPATPAAAKPPAASVPAAPASSAPVDEAPTPQPEPATPAPISEVPAPQPEASPTESSPSPPAALQVVRTVSGSTAPPVVPLRAASVTPRDEGASPAAHHSAKLLTKLQKGQPKNAVFELFGTAFVKQDGKIVEVQGMRLRGSAQSKSDTRLEVSEVALADGDERATPYWFLFENDRLVAWGRAEQWGAAASGLDVRRALFEAKVALGPDR